VRSARSIRYRRRRRKNKEGFNLNEPKKMNAEQMKARLWEDLKESRYRHTLGVADTAVHLAGIYHCDTEQALTAGLLHDCAKYMPDEDRIAYCDAHQVPVTDSERENLTLLHAKCGAIMAEEVYGVTDPQILHAIAVHTTGAPEMNLLDKIIFVADYIEPGRKEAPHLDELRALAETDLDLTVYRILWDTLEYLRAAGRTIDDTTQASLDAAGVRIQERKSDIDPSDR